MLDVVARYAPVVNKIKKYPPKDKKIVEIGGTGEGLGFYLPNYQIYDCDIRFVENLLPNTNPVKGRGEKIPLPDNFAEIIVSVDTLEHLPTFRKRTQMIKEMIRVAARLVILAVPTGTKSKQAIEKFGQLFKAKYPNIDYQYLNEHLKYQPPENGEIIKTIKEAGIPVRVSIKKNTNIKVWLLFQRFYLRFPKLYLIFRYRRFWYHLLKPVFPLLNQGETLRTIFFVQLEKTGR
ncbi:MAG TPA: class I SAM-dependent methyltransferase [Candidatus Bathyarchaeia archaeon]|nr:class I SAM-dependent methyltransferase [Candidatus Bathyarchaeia archaeon]